jgi:hypothetical protein
MSSEPKIVPAEISKKLAEIALSATTPDTQVILVGDNNHFRATETIGVLLNQSFWDDIKKTGKKPVYATEKLIPEHKPLIDALAQGKIEKVDFVRTFSMGGRQLSDQEGEVIFSGVADLIKSGVKVVGINNWHGMAYGSEEGIKALKKSQEFEIEIRLDWLSYWKENKGRFASDLKGETSNLLNRAQEYLEMVPVTAPYQRKELVLSIAQLSAKLEKNEVINESDIDSIFFAMHPRANEALAGRPLIDGYLHVQDRISKDDEVVRLIQQETYDPNALVVVSYGGAHMAGLYKQLEKAGVNTTPPIMPYLGPDHFKCMKPSDSVCMGLEGLAGEAQKFLDDQFKGSLLRRDTPQIKIADIYELKP